MARVPAFVVTTGASIPALVGAVARPRDPGGARARRGDAPRRRDGSPPDQPAPRDGSPPDQPAPARRLAPDQPAPRDGAPRDQPAPARRLAPYQPAPARRRARAALQG